MGCLPEDHFAIGGEPSPRQTTCDVVTMKKFSGDLLPAMAGFHGADNNPAARFSHVGGTNPRNVKKSTEARNPDKWN